MVDIKSHYYFGVVLPVWCVHPPSFGFDKKSSARLANRRQSNELRALDLGAGISGLFLV